MRRLPEIEEQVVSGPAVAIEVVRPAEIGVPPRERAVGEVEPTDVVPAAGEDEPDDRCARNNFV